MGSDDSRKTGIPFALRLLLALAGTGAAAALVWLSVTVHLERACVVLDTPYLPLCPETVSDAEQRRALRARIAANPGDSGAWVELTHLEKGGTGKGLLRAAFTLAPTDPSVLMWRAGEALSSGQLPEAVELLVQLIEYRGTGEAVQALAKIVASGEGAPLLRPHLARAGRWLPPVLASLAAMKLPLTSALPLVAEAWAQKAITRQTLQAYIHALKTDEKWADAYALWLTEQPGPTPLLYNGGFDQPFQPDGFDWEVTPALASRAGAVVSQRRRGDRGYILEIQFTGRQLAVPIIRQYVFAAPGSYVFRGKYLGSRLRTEQGLAWAVRCSSRNAATPLAGRSIGLQDTAGAWKRFQFSVVIASDCGSVVSVQLETLAPFEAATGMKGAAEFDAVEFVPQGL